MQYVQLDIVQYAAMILEAAKLNGETIVCEVGPHDEPATYLIPDATRPGGGGQDVEQRPAMVCREHLEEMLGHAPEEQPMFRRFRGPGTDPEVHMTIRNTTEGPRLITDLLADFADAEEITSMREGLSLPALILANDARERVHEALRLAKVAAGLPESD